MKRLTAFVLAVLTAMVLSVTANATEETALELIAERESGVGLFGQSVNEQIEAERKAREAELARQREAERRARQSRTVETVATDKSYEGAYYLGVCEITAYCACEKCCGKSDGITATGTKATQGRTVAVDPSVIPYGSVVIINGHEYIAEDCGGGIGGTQIDMFFNSHQDALNWGRRWLDVWVKEG